MEVSGYHQLFAYQHYIFVFILALMNLNVNLVKAGMECVSNTDFMYLFQRQRLAVQRHSSVLALTCVSLSAGSVMGTRTVLMVQMRALRLVVVSCKRNCLICVMELYLYYVAKSLEETIALVMFFFCLVSLFNYPLYFLLFISMYLFILSLKFSIRPVMTQSSSVRIISVFLKTSCVIMTLTAVMALMNRPSVVSMWCPF